MARKPEYRKTDVRHLHQVMEAYKSTPAELSRSIGISDRTVSAWLRAGEAPYWSLIACEGLMRRKQQPAKAIIVALVDNDKYELVEQFLTAIGATSGKRIEFDG